MFHGDVRVKTVPVLVSFSTGCAGVLDSLNVRLNVLLHVSSRLPSHNCLPANSADPRSILLSERMQISLVKVKYPEYVNDKLTNGKGFGEPPLR